MNSSDEVRAALYVAIVQTGRAPAPADQSVPQAWEGLKAPRYSRYASAKPICATNIMRYMCAQETWFSSTARSSGRRSIR